MIKEVPYLKAEATIADLEAALAVTGKLFAFRLAKRFGKKFKLLKDKEAHIEAFIIQEFKNNRAVALVYFNFQAGKANGWRNLGNNIIDIIKAFINAKVDEYLAEGMEYPQAMQFALNDLTVDEDAA